MSKEAVHSDGGEILAVIREECSAVTSSTEIKPPKEEHDACQDCSCLAKNEAFKESISLEDVEILLKQKEHQLTAEFQKQLEQEISAMKNRCEFILQNEQIRASCMLREAHRERQEKISALQTQLECKNLAGLMFVMCSERRKSKLEKLRLIEQYTGYIVALQDILTEAQDLILNMSRGYKTAARVDEEWREKMKVTLEEFQIFIHDFVKGTPDTEQFFFNIPAMLTTQAPIFDNPREDPCDCPSQLLQQQKEGLEEEKKTWYDNLGESCRPFVVFGDLETFQPPERREVLRKMKFAKVAPRKWKDYVFNEMYAKAECSNVNSIKDVYHTRLPVVKGCDGTPEYNEDINENEFLDPPMISVVRFQSAIRHRATDASVDIRGNMGSILKIITQNTTPQPRATLLGARDSMEIASTTKLKERTTRQSDNKARVVIKVGSRHTFTDDAYVESNDALNTSPEPVYKPHPPKSDVDVDGLSALGSAHNDSIHMIGSHVPDKDAKINYEKICPMEKCQRLQVDSFIRTLPPYMRANPYTHFEQTYEEYETCTPDQLEILKQRLQSKRGLREVPEEDPLVEWTPSVEGVGVQTSELSVSIPACTCRAPSPTPASSVDGIMFDVKDLIPVKQALDEINRDCFYDTRIDFDRFKVIGEEDASTRGVQKKDRLQDITKILKLHPSLLDIFQANAL